MTAFGLSQPTVTNRYITDLHSQYANGQLLATECSTNRPPEDHHHRVSFTSEMMMHEAVDGIVKTLSVSVVVHRYTVAQVSCLSKIEEH